MGWSKITPNKFKAKLFPEGFKQELGAGTIQFYSRQQGLLSLVQSFHRCQCTL